MWIFGYGSLVWKVDFPYNQKCVGYIKGFKRRFWQASVDHRGVPQKPGRVVTLIKSENPEEKTWGVAYEVIDGVCDAGSNLDTREKTYTKRLELSFYPKDGSVFQDKVLVYAGTRDKSLRLGPAPVKDMAQQIFSSKGPSGTNIEYVKNLALFLENQTPTSVEEDETFGIVSELNRLASSERCDTKVVYY